MVVVLLVMVSLALWLWAFLAALLATARGSARRYGPMAVVLAVSLIAAFVSAMVWADRPVLAGFAGVAGTFGLLLGAATGFGQRRRIARVQEAAIRAVCEARGIP